ncbi:hypothetical protein J6590_038173 [Homalodisca vitripennis]|nr:hypothetical protein J6590_038173 [Homalodisca vitripennis]
MNIGFLGHCTRVTVEWCVIGPTSCTKPEVLRRTGFASPECPESSSFSSGKSGTTAVSKEFLINIMEDFKKEMLNEFWKITTGNSSFADSLKFLNGIVEENNKLMDGISKKLKIIQD